VSSTTWFTTSDSKATNRPSEVIAGNWLPIGETPPAFDVIRRVVPFTRSRTKMSMTPFVSPVTRLVSAASKTTNRPLGEIFAYPLQPVASFSAELTLTRLVVLSLRSRTKTSDSPLVSC
jgi:hypothetical protein